MTAIYLHGAAAGLFGPCFNLEVNSPAEAVRALCTLKKGFLEHLKGYDWRIIRGPTKAAVRQGRDTSKEEIPMQFGSHQEMHLIPVISGSSSKGKGIGKIVAGVVIIAASIFTAGGALPALAAGMAAVGITSSGLAMFGASMLLGGISQMLASNPKASKVQDREDSTQRTNTLFNGPVNVGELGQTIPVTISGPGGVLVGTVVGSAGIYIEQITP
nr:hypothetical protein [uncultured Dongia sp.]